MDHARFDALTRLIGSTESRRRLGGALIGAVAGSLGLGEAAAASCPKGKKRCKAKCIPKRQCCTNAQCQRPLAGGICRRGSCQCAAGKRRCGRRCIPRGGCCPVCPPGQACQGGRCCIATSAALHAALGPGGPAVIRLCPGTVFQGNFTIARNVTIIGAAGSILDGGAAGRVVSVASGAVELRTLQVRNGGNSSTGAGIRNDGTLLLTQCDVTANNDINSFNGGGIYNTGTLILDGTQAHHNDGAVNGGGIFNIVGTVTLRNGSSVHTNTAGNGGGIFNANGTVTLEDTSNLNSNVAVVGGGIYNQGLGDDAIVQLRGASRISANTADMNQGGGIFQEGSGQVTFEGTSCVGPNSGGNCVGAITCTICA